MNESLDGAGDARERLRSFHEAHGAVFESVGGGETGERTAVAHYGREGRTHRAVRNGIGVSEVPANVIVLEGADRWEYLNNVVTNRVPDDDGEGCYSLLLDPQGRIESDLYVYTASDRILVLTPPGVAASVVDGWETFIQDVTIRVATEGFAVFGVHGPRATEKVASVLTGASPPEERLAFVRGSIAEAGVTVVRTDAPAGEVGYEMVCATTDGPDVLDALVNRGIAAVPFGRATWRGLTLEAGTPLFESELRGRIPNVAGVRNAMDFEKGCFVGQEVVSKVENVGRPSRKLVGLELDGGPDDGLPESGATVSSTGDAVGEITRAATSPLLDARIAFAAVDVGLDEDADLRVAVDDEAVPASIEPLPFVGGSDRSARIPRYPD